MPEVLQGQQEGQTEQPGMTEGMLYSPTGALMQWDVRFAHCRKTSSSSCVLQKRIM